jgi:isoquinoline 1-oxidoreductase alpha subunit
MASSASSKTSGSTSKASSGTTVTLNVNGVNRSVTVSSTGTPLLWVLRDILGLTGTKYGCGIEICGACTVLVNNQAERSCDMSVSEAVGKAIMTVEGLANDPVGQQVQAAWVANQVPQCGYCQSGMMMAATASIKAGNHGSSIAGDINNLCACGSYQRIRNAIRSL